MTIPLSLLAGALTAPPAAAVGVSGFLRTPGLAAEDPDAGNYGFLDQQAALRWVERDTGSFGGRSSAVTIDGESAGGWSVCGHLVSPGSRGLFDRAMIQSGSPLHPDLRVRVRPPAGPGPDPGPGLRSGRRPRRRARVHLAELQQRTPIAPLFGASEQRLAREMTLSWGAFTRYGKPRVPDQAAWPRCGSRVTTSPRCSRSESAARAA